MLQGHEVNVKLFELLNKDHKLKTKTNAHANLLIDFVLEVDQVSGCMLIALCDPESVKLMVCTKRCDALLVQIVKKFTRVHTIPTIYKILHTRYKDQLNMLPREMQQNFNRLTNSN